MEIRIGITNTGRELAFETDAPSADVKKTIETALDQGSNYLTLTDVKGNSYMIPTAGIAYIELGSEESRRIGFVA